MTWKDALPSEVEFAPLTDEDRAECARFHAEIIAVLKTGPRALRLELISALTRVFCDGCGRVQPEGGPSCPCQNDE